MKTMLDILPGHVPGDVASCESVWSVPGRGWRGGAESGEPVQPVSYSSAEAEPETEEVGGLRRRVADLERLVASLAPGKPSPRKRAGRSRA